VLQRPGGDFWRLRTRVTALLATGSTHDPKDGSTLRSSNERKENLMRSSVDRDRPARIGGMFTVYVDESRLAWAEHSEVAAFGSDVERGSSCYLHSFLARKTPTLLNTAARCLLIEVAL
jgi:hypothetical protein